jgi:hypothetical protein
MSELVCKKFEFDGINESYSLSNKMEKIAYLSKQFDRLLIKENHYCEKKGKIIANVVFVAPNFTVDGKLLFDHDRNLYYNRISEIYEIVANFSTDERLNIVAIITDLDQVSHTIDKANGWIDYAIFLHNISDAELYSIGAELSKNSDGEIYDGLFAIKVTE